MNLGTRSVGRAVRAPFHAAHWRALWKMAVVYPRFPQNLWRYVLGRGSYPYDCAARTPVGRIAPTLHSRYDMLTMNEIFCREDYRAGPSIQVAVDVGANIGIAALYFLTRNDTSRVYSFEPVPRNVERFHENVKQAGADRCIVEEVAVATRDGEVTFAVEETGRYGRIDDAGTLTVRSRDINAILDDILSREARIDVLKIDTEGTEVELVSAIRDDLLDRISVIVYETDDPTPPHGDRFRSSYRVETMRLVREGVQ